MINATTALIGFAGYAAAVFVFGLIWRKREVADKNRKGDPKVWIEKF